MPLPALLLSLAAFLPSTSVVQVGAGTDAASAIQSAVDNCPASGGCRIELTDAKYVLKQAIWIENKADIEITSGRAESAPVITWDPALMELVANPDSGQAKTVERLFTLTPPPGGGRSDSGRVAGWLMWPYRCSPAGTPGSSVDTSNTFSTSGNQMNGMFLVRGSKRIRFSHLELDGVKPAFFENNAIWSCKYSVIGGNVGINTFLSLQVEISDCNLHHFWSAIYIDDRNTQCLAYSNSGDLDRKVWLGSCSIMGGHLIQRNRIHDCWWGANLQSTWDLGSTLRHNLVWNNRRDTALVLQNSSEAKRQIGGFLLIGDDRLTSHVVTQNSVLSSPYLAAWNGSDPFRSTVFSENLVGHHPWSYASNYSTSTELFGYARSQTAKGNRFLRKMEELGCSSKLVDSLILVGEILQRTVPTRCTSCQTVKLSPSITFWTGGPSFGSSDYNYLLKSENWSFPMGGWQSGLGATSGTAVRWWDSVAVDSVEFLSSMGIATTNAFRLGDIAHDATDSLAPKWSDTATTSFLTSRQKYGMAAGAHEQGSSNLGGDLPTLFMANGSPSMDVTGNLTLPFRTEFPAGTSQLVLLEGHLTPRSPSSGSDSLPNRPFPFAGQVIEMSHTSLTLATSGLLKSSDTIVQINLWMGAIVGSDTIPLTPASWIWAKGMKGTSLQPMPVGLSSRNRAPLRIGSARRDGNGWILDIRGLETGASAQLTDLFGRKASIRRVSDAQFRIDEAPAGTWFLRSNGAASRPILLMR